MPAPRVALPTPLALRAATQAACFCAASPGSPFCWASASAQLLTHSQGSQKACCWQAQRHRFWAGCGTELGAVLRFGKAKRV